MPGAKSDPLHEKLINRRTKKRKYVRYKKEQAGTIALVRMNSNQNLRYQLVPVDRHGASAPIC